MKYLFYPAFLTAMGMLTACSDNAVESMDENIPQDQKTEIAFTLSAQGASAQTRADATTHGFSAETDIVARYESYKTSAVGTVPGDDAEKRTTRTVLHAQAEADGTGYSEASYQNATDFTRYWDDAYSRLAYISVYAVAVPGKQYDLKNNNEHLINLVKWSGEEVSSTNIYWKKNDNGADANDIAWTVSSTQTTATLENEDLCYSNNIQRTGKNGRYVWDFTSTPQDYKPAKTGATTHADGQMRIALQNNTDKTSTGHFDRGHLVFNHALTRLTVNMKKGNGFKTTDPFAFKDDTNVKIKGVPTASTLNIKTGTWATTPTTTGDIAKMNQLDLASTGYDYTLQSQFIPGFVFNKDSNTPVLEYTIDDNVYSITEGAIYKALEGKHYEDNTPLASNNEIEMKQGKNYVINVAVNKTAIATVTATIVNWEEINTGEIAPKNDYITISNMMGPTTEHCNNFALYRADADVNNIYSGTGTLPTPTNWFRHYTGPATLTQKLDASNNPTNVWSTNWFWESNKSFYHFRTVNQGTTVKQGTETPDPKDYFEVTSGQLATANDYHWGAPMNSGATMKYDETKGFEDFLYPAIGATTDQIDIIEHHIMSNVHIVLHTDTKTDDVTTLADNGVVLKNTAGTTAKVELNRFCNKGKVELARGLVNATSGVQESAAITAPSPYYKKDVNDANKDNIGETNKYSYRIVPQALNRSTADADKIGLTITTPDGNKYFVPELAIVEATSVGTNNQHHTLNQPVIRWYPGYDYTYHIRLHKTKIESITCSIVDWVKVETGSIDIGL